MHRPAGRCIFYGEGGTVQHVGNRSLTNVVEKQGIRKERFAKRAQRTNLFGLCRAQETKVALPRYQRLPWG